MPPISNTKIHLPTYEFPDNAAIGLIATLLPWFRVSVFGYSESINAWHGIGFLAVLGFIMAGAVALMGIQTVPLTSTSWFLALGGGALALLGTVIYWLRLPSANGIGGASIGLFLSLAAGAGVVAFAWMNRAPGATIQSGFDSMKRDINDRTGNNNNGPTPPPPGNNPLQ